MPDFEFLKITHQNKVAEVSLNRPDKANALHEKMWFEVEAAFRWADETPDVRAVILRSEGSRFCSGIDFEFVHSIGQRMGSLPDGRRQEQLLATIRALQKSFTMLETCRKPVIAAIQGVCYGGGIDLVTACDIRHASADATFSVKEVDLGIVADIGTLQRLPKIVGEGRAREWALTGKVFQADEAQRAGLINEVTADAASLLELARGQAAQIAEKSPLAVRGTKQVLNYSRDHTVAEGLEHVATWNAGMLLSHDLRLAVEAAMGRKKANFPD
ncbi:MAG TPA: crotonase/enoyl-CoA hydratase family protein [Oligoflexus sp.]|uniref:crotonase/enoyl-CoA hydratase family protein n=1 Tax=Oligoflexus sp. TaxID=1971216 RepID=UPI002D3ADB37|nr:crotonase/enoyl-CoA hydratase family protein [Oligoflexus sp.]HYX31955.1 crotonase/enoyl-CoA hydratase family protein [Oligoflexus sp.]